MSHGGCNGRDHRPRQRKTKGRTYTGCWTCRARHLKCDETRPHCTRCTSSGRICEGYDTRLFWSSSRNISSDPAQHYPVTSESPQGVVTTGDEDKQDRGSQDLETRTWRIDPESMINHAAHTLEEATFTTHRRECQVPEGLPISLNPRNERAQQQQNHTASTDVESVQSSTASSSQTNLFCTHKSQANPIWISGWAKNVAEQDLEVPALFDGWTQNDGLQDVDIAVLLGGERQSESINSVDGLSESRALTPRPSNTSRPYSSTGSLGQTAGPRANSVGQSLCTLPISAPQIQLIQNWVVHLADAMCPIPGPWSPLRRVMVPIALAGAKESPGKNTAATAVFHLICSVSASHLAFQSHDDKKWSVLALAHHNLGLAHLRNTIMLKDTSQSTAVLAAIFMCIETECFPVAAPSWRMHMRAACEWVSQVSINTWTQSDSASTLFQMFAAGFILLKPQISSYCLDQVYGLQRSILVAIDTLNDLVRAKDRIQITEKNLDALEMELLLSIPEFSSPSNNEEPTHGLFVYHNQSIFYHGVLIYLRRAVRHTPVHEVQCLVEKCLQSMEALLKLSKRLPCSPLLWPVVVTAFEAATPHLQERSRSWFLAQTHQTGLEVWQSALKIVNLVWELRRQHDGGQTTVTETIKRDCNWQHYLKHIPYPEFPLV
ncbi:hypothetical protein LTR41_011245 [Exophiala xenobiotica]|nr:hypothetical protein LTR41_011245 [Exophiala xenobiotica]KAK5550926.1 hypothetical protein LTR46_011069 [Exophiala xenobiotica]